MNQTINRKDNTEAKTAHWEHWKLGQLQFLRSYSRDCVPLQIHEALNRDRGFRETQRRHGDVAARADTHIGNG